MDNWASTFLPIVVLILAFWLLVLRPARSRQREFQGLQRQLEPGQQVMLASGIFGETVTVGEDTVELQIAPGTVVKVNRHAIARILPAEVVSEEVDGTDD